MFLVRDFVTTELDLWHSWRLIDKLLAQTQPQELNSNKIASITKPITLVIFILYIDAQVQVEPVAAFVTLDHLVAKTGRHSARAVHFDCLSHP